MNGKAHGLHSVGLAVYHGDMKVIFVSVICLLVASPSLRAQPAKPTHAQHLAMQAREILRRNCIECHHAEPRRKGNLNVLDHVLLLDQERKLVIPSLPDRSRLLELIEDGSMPQKKLGKVPEAERQVLRAWIETGAGPWHQTHSDSYILARVLEDVRKLNPEDRPNVRYVSLNHLLTETEPRTDLDAYRLALERQVQAKVKPGKFNPKPIESIEPTQTVFRINLQALGWTEPFLKSKDRSLNRFDLLLLDYPYAVLPDKSAEYAELGQVFLEPAKQVRPIPFLRGDWFLNVVSREKTGQLFDKHLDLAAARAELDWPRPANDQELSKTFALPQFQKLGLGPLVNGGTVRRDVWEKAFASVVRHLKLGTPVLPLDSSRLPDWPAELLFRLELSAQDPKEKKPKTRFTIDKDQMVIVVESVQNLYIEVIWTDSKGKIFLVPYTSRFAEAGTTVRIVPKDQEGFTIRGPAGKDQLTLYAWDVRALADAKDFPAGVIFRGEGETDRFVHPFYAGWYDAKQLRKLDPARAIKRTIEIEIK